MIYSKETIRFAEELVHHYAKWDKYLSCYSLDISDLPDFVQDEFAALIMAEDDSLASEATGPDNKHWENKMLPSLLRYLKKSTDQDEAIEFKNTWRECVTSYFFERMQELIDVELGDFNYEHGYYKTPEEMYGVPRTL